MNTPLAFASLLIGLAAVATHPAGAQPASSEPFALILPTPNEALLNGTPDAFYQYTDRIFRGVRSRPWQGGQYGFVRDEEETPVGIVFTRFHEGVDIKPVRRNGAGEPLDRVHAVAEGRVVYVNYNERQSSYGKYVVVEHQWDGVPVYSLYAHLNRIGVRRGQAVGQGDVLGRLGYTGPGINRRRAHLHFELNLMLSEHFQTWYDQQDMRDGNVHGLFNGVNLAGLDVPALYLTLAQEPGLSLGEFVRQEEVAYRVLMPNTGRPDVLNRYPWLDCGEAAAEDIAWELSFARSGLPICITPSDRVVPEPTLSYVTPAIVQGYLGTNRRLARDAEGRFSLTERGRAYVHLIALPGTAEAPRSTR